MCPLSGLHPELVELGSELLSPWSRSKSFMAFFAAGWTRLCFLGLSGVGVFECGRECRFPLPFLPCFHYHVGLRREMSVVLKASLH